MNIQVYETELTGKKPRILWFAYPKKGGWAFENRTYGLISKLPQFDHVVISPVRNLKLIEGILYTMDIIVVWHDIDYSQIEPENKSKIIQCFTGDRMFQKIMARKPLEKILYGDDIINRK